MKNYIKLLLVFVLVFTIYSRITSAAVDVDNEAVDIGDATAETIHTFSLVVAGSDRVLTLGLFTPAFGAPDVTGAKYAGFAMDEVADLESSDSEVRGWYFTLANPATGTNDVEITLASSGHARHVYIARSFTGASDTFGTVQTAENTEASDTDPQVTVTGAADGMVTDFAGARRSAITLTEGGSQSNVVTQLDFVNRASISTRTGTGSLVMDWTTNVAAAWVHFGILINPVGAAPAFVPKIQWIN